MLPNRFTDTYSPPFVSFYMDDETDAVTTTPMEMSDEKEVTLNTPQPLCNTDDDDKMEETWDIGNFITFNTPQLVYNVADSADVTCPYSPAQEPPSYTVMATSTTTTTATITISTEIEAEERDVVTAPQPNISADANFSSPAPHRRSTTAAPTSPRRTWRKIPASALSSPCRRILRARRKITRPDVTYFVEEEDTATSDTETAAICNITSSLLSSSTVISEKTLTYYSELDLQHEVRQLNGELSLSTSPSIFTEVEEPRVLVFRAGQNIFANCDHAKSEELLPTIKRIAYANTQETIEFESIASIITRVMRRCHITELNYAITPACRIVDKLAMHFEDRVPFEVASYLNSKNEPHTYYFCRHYVPSFCVNEIEVIAEQLVEENKKNKEQVVFYSGMLEILSYIVWKRCTTDLRKWYRHGEDDAATPNNGLYLKSFLLQLFRNTLMSRAAVHEDLLQEIVKVGQFEHKEIPTLSIHAMNRLKRIFPQIKIMLVSANEQDLLKQWEAFFYTSGIYTRSSSLFAAQCCGNISNTFNYFKSTLVRQESVRISDIVNSRLFTPQHVQQLLHLSSSCCTTRDTTIAVEKLSHLLDALLWRCCSQLAAWTCSTLTSVSTKININLISATIHTFSNVWIKLWFPNTAISHDDRVIAERKTAAMSSLSSDDITHFCTAIRYIVQLQINELMFSGTSSRIQQLLRSDACAVIAIQDIAMRESACEALFFGIFYTILQQLTAAISASSSITVIDIYNSFSSRLDELSQSLAEDLALLPIRVGCNDNDDDEDPDWISNRGLPTNLNMLHGVIDEDDYEDEFYGDSDSDNDNDRGLDGDDNEVDGNAAAVAAIATAPDAGGDDYDLGNYLQFHGSSPKPKLCRRRIFYYEDFLRQLPLVEGVVVRKLNQSVRCVLCQKSTRIRVAELPDVKLNNLNLCKEHSVEFLISVSGVNDFTRIIRSRYTHKIVVLPAEEHG